MGSRLAGARLDCLVDHHDVPKLARAVRDELRRAAATISKMLDGIEEGSL